ncbi:MAG: hypothetical protein IJX66_07035 [Lachnospiraceae bacterium]|nr:hypothetical protein [Lachnospiraceae bacterium]
MEKKQMKTRITGLLALALAFMMLFSNSLPVMAAEYDVCDEDLSIGDEVVGGDVIEAGSGGLVVYIDGNMVHEYLGTTGSSYTVPAGPYQVSDYREANVIYYVYLTTPTPHVHIWEVKEVLKAADADTDAHGAWTCACGATKNEAIPNTGFATFLEDSCDEILNAEENSTVEIDTGIWGSLRDDVIEAIKEREDLTVKITLTHEKEQYLLVFGPDRDMSMLEEADWYGVLYLNQFFGVEQEADAE